MNELLKTMAIDKGSAVATDIQIINQVTRYCKWCATVPKPPDLPTVKQVAAHLKVTQKIVKQAYNTLIEEGWFPANVSASKKKADPDGPVFGDSQMERKYGMVEQIVRQMGVGPDLLNFDAIRETLREITNSNPDNFPVNMRTVLVGLAGVIASLEMDVAAINDSLTTVTEGLARIEKHLTDKKG